MSTTQTIPTRPSDQPEPPSASGLRLPLRIVAIGLALLLVGYGAVVAASLLARETKTRSATFQGITAIQLDTSFESVDVLGSQDATEVDLDRRWTWSTKEPTVSARRVGERLVVSSSCPWTPGLTCTGRVTLTVPPDVAVLGGTTDGHLLLSGLTGAVDAHTSDGGIELRDVTGPLRLSTRDGSVQGDGLRSVRVAVDTSDGGVRLGFAVPPTTVRASTTDGSVQVVVPDDGTAYRVDVSVADGSRDVQVPTDPDAASRITVHTGDGSARVLTGP